MFLDHEFFQLRHDFRVIGSDVVRFADVGLQVIQLDLERGFVVFAEDVLADGFPMSGPNGLLASIAREFAVEKLERLLLFTCLLYTSAAADE